MQLQSIIMKKQFSLLLFAVALLTGITTVQAQQTFKVDNPTACGYTIEVYVAPTGTCTGPFPATTITIPPFFSGLAYTTPIGTWAVGAHFSTFGIGLSSPIPGPCSSFPSNASFINLCGTLVSAQYIQGAPGSSSGVAIF